MKILGVKIVPVLAAAVVAYVIGALIYGVLFSKAWMTWSGATIEDFKGYEWRMAISWVMPLALAFGIGVRIKQLQITKTLSGLKLGLGVGLFLVLACRLYLFVYGTEPWQLLALDSFHTLLISGASGAILAAMNAGDA